MAPQALYSGLSVLDRVVGKRLSIKADLAYSCIVHILRLNKLKTILYLTTQLLPRILVIPRYEIIYIAISHDNHHMHNKLNIRN